MLRRIVVGVCGQNGSGKSTVCEVLAQRGFKVVSLSDAIRQELRERGLPETRENLIAMGTELRSRFSAGVLGERIVRTFRPDQNYVVDSIRHPAEVEAVRKAGNFTLVAVLCPPEVRYERLIARRRTGDVQTLEEFLRADALEQAHPDPAGQQLRAVVDMADVKLVNASALEQFQRDVCALADRLTGAAPSEASSTAAARATPPSTSS